MGQNQLIVLGAGPKAAALAAKANARRAVGFEAPKIVIVEQEEVGHHWTGSGGWSDGAQRLGSNPLKDVGFPYTSPELPEQGEVTRWMLSYRSWPAYLIANKQYADWVDRGLPSPTHREWANYLRWVINASDARLVKDRIKLIRLLGETRLGVDLEGGGCECGQGVVITGRGSSNQRLDGPVLSVADFWKNKQLINNLENSHVIVIGGGESAAAIARELQSRRETGRLTIISRRAAIYSRGESFFENRYFSHPGNWKSLPIDCRIEFLRRADRGVFSPESTGLLSIHGECDHMYGRVLYAKPTNSGVAVVMCSSYTPTRRSEEKEIEADCIIDATGGRPDWFLSLLSDQIKDDSGLSSEMIVDPVRCDSLLGEDLAINQMEAKLFLPNLAAIGHGPGFPNLTSLGLLADRILESSTWDYKAKQNYKDTAG